VRQASQQLVAEVLEGFWRLPEGPVGRYVPRPVMESLLAGDLPEHASDFQQVVAEVHNKVVPNAIRPSHPRFLAFVPSGPCLPALLGDWLCDGLNLFAGVWKEGAGPGQVELIVLDWFRQILGMPPEASGLLTSGGSEALLIAMVTARERLSYEERGRAVLYTSDQRHWSVDRGARIAGFRPDQIRALPAGADLRLSVDVLRQAVKADARADRVPWLVVAHAGTTNTGTVDPIDRLADFCAEHGLWLHADAAYGWAAALSDRGKHLLHGIERADSISLDPHKWFAQTYDVGCLLVRAGPALTRTFATQPEYLQDVQAAEDEVNFADRGIALTRRFRALKIWMSVKTLGLGWFRRLVQHGLTLAEYAERALAQNGDFELLAERQLSVVCFRCTPIGWHGDLDALNRAVCAEAVRTGRVFLATTRVRGLVAQRFCFVNWRTTAADVDEVITLLATIARRLTHGEDDSTT
jgi:glutamate/tyrosine decarboxylase-like PLP-dependent enzyme